MYTDCTAIYNLLRTFKIENWLPLAIMERQYLYIFCLIIPLLYHSLFWCANVLVMDGFSILYKKQTKLILKVVQTHTIQCTYNFLQYTEAVDTLVTETGSGLLGLSNLGLDIWIKFRFQITGLRIGQSKINIYQFCTSVIKVKTTLDIRRM